MKRFLARAMVFLVVIFLFSGLNASEQLLMNAVRRGNLKDVKKYLDLGFTQEVVDSSGRNLLLQAAAYNHLNLVEFFIGNRANISKMDHKGNTILHFLAENRSAKAPALIKQALQSGAFLGAKNYEGQTPAGSALKKGNSAGFKVFLDAGYDKNSIEGGMPVVLFAYLKGQNAIVKSLMEAGADINRADAAGEIMLHHAAMRNDGPMVKDLLDKGAQINARSADGRTALMYALEKNRIPIAELLIKKGADVNATDRKRQNILHYLAPLQQAGQLIALLPAEGVNVNAKDDTGRTPLLVAAMSARWSNVELFASKGADVNIADSTGKTPVLMAAEKGNLTAVKTLIDRGSDVKKADASGQTVLHYLAGQRGKAVVQMIPEIIAKGGQVNAKSASGATPAGMAVAGGNTAVFAALLESGIDKDGLELNSLPLAVFAYEKRQKEIAKTLLEKGADVKKTGSLGETMLHAVAAQDDWQFANFVLGYNPDLNARDDTGRTPLLSAIDKSAIRVAGLLIEKGADVNVKDRQGQTSLHYLAAARNATGLMAKAQAAGIKVDAKDNSGRTPLAIAVESNRVDNVEYLLNMGADVNGTDHNGVDLILVAYGKNRAMLNLFITKGGSLDAKSPDGKTLLLMSLEQNDTPLLKLLTEKGANVNERQANGKYPLEFAIEKRHFNNTKLLLDSKADFRVRDAKGNPLLTLAIEKKTESIAKILLEKGADPNGTDAARKPHLLQAFDENQPEIFKSLIDYNADLNVKDANGASILSLAAEKNRTGFMKTLLDKNVDVNPKDSNSNTPVIIASWKGYYEPVKMLLDKGADVNHRGQEGESALFKAVDAPYRAGQIITLLAKQGGDVKAVNGAGDTLLHRSIKARKFDLFEQFLKLGADPNIANKSGDTLLMQLSNIDPPSGKGAGYNKMAAENRDTLKLIRTLLKNGADPNVMNRYGQSALNSSRVKRNFEIVTTLLGAGAKVNLQDKAGNTVLKKEVMDYIGNYRMLDPLKQSSQKMIDLFVTSGGDINIRDKFGSTALTHVAKEINSKNEKKVLNIIPYLLGKGARKDIKDNDNKSALDYARQSGNSELIRILSGGY
jgi:ankyrin repeat protein